MPRIQLAQVVDAPIEQVYALLTSRDQLPKLLRPILDVEVRAGDSHLSRGAEYSFYMTRYGLSQLVRLRVEDLVVGRRLTYRQILGLFKDWVHTMQFEEVAPGQTLVTDSVDYVLPFGLLGHLVSDLWAKRDMEGMLSARLERARAMLADPVKT